MESLVLGLDHPPPWDAVEGLETRRVVAASLTLLILVLTLMPEPISVVEPIPVPVYPGERIPVSAPQMMPAGFAIQL